MLKLSDVEPNKRVRLCRAIHALKSGNVDYQEFLVWIMESLDQMRQQSDTIVDETQLRMMQGRCQALQGIVDIHKEASEMIRRT